MKNDIKVILGIDPGLEKTGYGLIRIEGNREKLIEGGVVRSKRSESMEFRLVSIYKGISEIISEFKPSVIAIEEIFIHKSYPKTALIMGYVRGVILMSAGLNSIPVFNYPATTIKKFLTGSGRASKDQIQRMVKKRLNINNTLTPDDVSDAIAIALCHSSAVLNNI